MKPGSKGLVVYKSKILLYLRDNKPNIPYPNYWDMPGGGKEKGETFKQAALREVKEEFSIEPKDIIIIGYESYKGRKAYRFIAFLSEKEYKKIKLGDEGQKFNFFTIDKTLNLNLMPSLKMFVENNQKYLKEIIEEGRPIDKSKFMFIRT